jgi:outer membrane scaffolding protein for murein synthesis (MipA/OmpV family)
MIYKIGYRHDVLAALLLSLAAAPLAAQQMKPDSAPNVSTLPTVSKSRLAENRLSVAAGVLISSDYEGSNDYVLSPGFGATARFKGHNISYKGTSLAVDLIPEYRDQKFKVFFSPYVSLNLDRSEVTKDPVVALFRKRKVAVEGGASFGFTRQGVLTSQYDALTVQVSAQYDLGNVHKSFVISPTVEYTMPVSKRALVGASLAADFVGGRYARYYFGVGNYSSTVSGLPVFRPSGGLKSVTAGLVVVHSLGSDLRKGFVVGALVNYERLVGDFANSPLVAKRGNPNQMFGALGMGYSF